MRIFAYRTPDVGHPSCPTTLLARAKNAAVMEYLKGHGVSIDTNRYIGLLDVSKTIQLTGIISMFIIIIL
jgi:hypothetical protein